MYDADPPQITEPFEEHLIRDWFFPVSRAMGLYGHFALQLLMLYGMTNAIFRQVYYGATRSAYMLATGLAIEACLCLTLGRRQSKRQLGINIGLFTLQAALILGSEHLPGSAPLDLPLRVLPFAYPFVFGEHASMLSERTYRRQRRWVVGGFLAIALITAAYTA